MCDWRYGLAWLKNKRSKAIRCSERRFCYEAKSMVETWAVSRRAVEDVAQVEGGGYKQSPC